MSSGFYTNHICNETYAMLTVNVKVAVLQSKVQLNPLKSDLIVETCQ